jgi:hypothetical protein
MRWHMLVRNASHAPAEGPAVFGDAPRTTAAYFATVGLRVCHDLFAPGFLGKLRAALKPLGARLTTYNNMYDPVISDFEDIQHSVDRLLDGDTYNYHTVTGHTGAQNFSAWLTHYHDTVVNANISRGKAGVSMLASTERGDWNCEGSTMAQRMAQVKADKVPEVAIFILRSVRWPALKYCFSVWTFGLRRLARRGSLPVRVGRNWKGVPQSRHTEGRQAEPRW